MRSIVILCIIVGLFLVGCGPQATKEGLRPAPSSSISKSEWWPVIKAWLEMHPKNTWAPIHATGSMAPYIDSTSIILIQVVKSTDLKKGDVANYIRSDGVRVVHSVVEVNERGAVLFSGDNNDGLNADGWIPADRVWGRVAATLNTNGK